MKTIYPILAAALLAASLPALAATNGEADATNGREVFIEEGQRNGKAASVTRSETKSALETTGPRIATRGNAKTRNGINKLNEEFWIFDAVTAVAFDEDRDGYYTRLELEFDADTVFVEADVYAVLYLSRDGGPWNEFTTTAIFTIFGASDDDDYFVDTDLLSGYPPGSYDVLIELYDAFDGALVAEFGPDDSLELYDLPLEDQQSDELIIIIDDGHHHSGGGSTGFAALALLAGLAGARLRRRRA